MDLKTIVFVFIGGGLGSISRYLLSLTGKYIHPILPIGTFLSNIISCIILGLLFGVMANRWTEESMLKSFVAIGFCGGFSTFSTFTLETFIQLKMGNNLIALGNIFLNFTVSFIFLLLGLWLAKFF